ncbi:DUF1048 domain-containing protein [Nocardia macrotermitis]|uniref:DNA-binding ferritin-like protein (Dps family) n=1 Tax=Nocardia macrotermitis TaxID=2585198 RepID=A0A7K0DEX3_9NOCA|nr:DUF1048 domain-containing protein [Nocardia macrotermitis]MQY24267.1 hypothetical protein [Nocardia macrotermitis]
MSESKLPGKLLSTVVGDLGEKRRWRQYRARAKQLPEPYSTAIEAFQRYLMYGAGGGGGVAMFEDLIDLFEQSAADRAPLREIVGDDPVEFIETFARNYQDESWIKRERERLGNAIAKAAGENVGNEG